MTADVTSKRGIVYRVLTVAALILMAVAYVSPIWWVSLAAPQYSHEAFPDGIRIHFHFDGVYNGCKQPERAELDLRGEELDCKSEMDTINHYVGMYPIAAGAPVERALSPFLVSILAVVMIAFMMPNRKVQVTVMATGGAAIVAWASVALFTAGGIHWFTPGFVKDMAHTMSLEPADYDTWTGMQAIRASYEEGLGRYFREAAVIERATAAMMTATTVVYAIIIAAVVILTVALAMIKAGPWLLGLVPAVLPIAFVADYASWLYWFGHNLNDMGAFTVKPFMPTVFGDGKVAQFATYSYPHYGYALLLGLALLMVVAALIRRKQLAET